MPLFVAAGAYLAATGVGISIAATLGISAAVLGGIAAVSLAYITSRVINSNSNKGRNSAANEGGRIQVAPATNNKIPVVYGSAYVNGIITDARLISLEQKKNDKMFYCIVLSEYTNNLTTPIYGLEGVYWNDLRLTPLNSTNFAHIVKDGRKVVDGAIVNAGSFVFASGSTEAKTYIITKIGTTDFTLIGAPTNNIGQIFTATGAGTGTGQAQEEDFIDKNFIVDDKQHVELRVYAGGSSAADQIYPAQSTGNTANAYNFWGSGGTLYPNGDGSWTTGHEMNGLVFAIVSVRYNGEKGFTGLPNMTFQLANNVSNPADVWKDYMTSQRYGAGIPAAELDDTARTAWYNFCEEDINYTNVAGETNQSTTRYSINGVIDTSNPVKTNIDSIMQNGGAWLSYNVDTGLWSPIIKKAVTAGELGLPATYFTASRSTNELTVTNFPTGRIEPGQRLYNSANAFIDTITAQIFPLLAGESTGQLGRYTTSTSGNIASTTFYTLPVSMLEFDDDNIISGISISSTRLDDLYNSVESEFYNKYNKDQKAYARNNIDDNERNPNEPDNQLRMNLELCNNSMQADLIGQLELRQSRDDLVVEFTTTHYGIQAQAGDVVSIYSDLYGWSPKYFRVMRVKETEGDNGILTANIQALEYNPDVYTIEPLTEFSTSANIGIGVYGSSPNLPLPPAVVIASVDADAAIPNFELQIEIPTTGGPFDEIELFYTEGWDQHPITGTIVPGTGSNGAPVGQGLLTVTATTYGNINAGDRIDMPNPTPDIYIVSQITNTVGSKTFVSGGVPASPTSTLLTLNNVTGLIVGNTLTGTGIPNGSFIIEIDAGTNTVRIEDAVTVQAAGTYQVTGGLGTYIVDTSTTATLTALDLYDFPEADNYKPLKIIVPQGNTATFTNGEIIRDVITNVPANSATYRRWFIKARMGIKKRFGAFSNPGATDFTTGRFPYTPNPVASGSLGDLTDVTLTPPINEGDFLWYDGTTWINTNEPSVDSKEETLQLNRRYTTANREFEASIAQRLNGRVTDATNDNTDDAGPALRFERSSGTQSTKTYVSGGAIGAFTVTLNNVTGLVVGNKVTGTGLPDGNGALITIIAGNQLTLDTAFTVQASGTYTIGEPVGFGQLAFEYFGTTDVHRFRVSTSTDNYFEDPVDTYPGTKTLILSSKNATDINEGKLYVDAVNGRVGINNTSPSYELHIDNGTDSLTQFAMTNNERTFLISNNAGSDKLSFNYNGADRLEFNLTNQWFNSGRLGINNSSPGYTLDVTGDAYINDNLTVRGSTFLGNNYIIDSTSVVGNFSVTNNSVNNLQVLYSNGYVGINNAAPLYTLDVNGTANIETSLTVPSISTLTGDDLNITAFSGRDVNISTTASADPVTIVRNISTNNDSIRTLTLRANTTNASPPVIGFGNFLEFETESQAGTFVRSGYINNKSTGDNAGVLDEFNMSFGVMSAGVSTEGMVLDNLGNLSILGTTLTLNSDGTGTEDITILFERAASDTYIKYNESTDRFEFNSPITTLTNLGARFSEDLFGTGYHGAVVAGTTGTISTGGELVFQRNGGTYPTDNATIRVDRVGGATDATIIWNESNIRWEISNDLNVPQATIGNIDIDRTNGTITTNTGDLTLDSASGTVLIDDNLNVASGVLFVDDSNNFVGINKTNPTAALDVTGGILASIIVETPDIVIDQGDITHISDASSINRMITSVRYNTIVGTGITVVDSWSPSLGYRSAKYTFTCSKGGDHQSVEVMIIHDGTNSYLNTYSDIATGINLITISTDITGFDPVVNFKITPTTTGTLKYILKKELFKLV